MSYLLLLLSGCMIAPVQDCKIVTAYEGDKSITYTVCVHRDKR